MRTVILNCWGGRIRDHLLHYLVGLEADVYCLMEVHLAPPSVPDAVSFSYKHRPDADPPVYPHLYRDFKRHLPEHESRFYPMGRGQYFAADQSPHWVSYGLAAFIRESLPVLGEKMEMVHGCYQPNGWVDPPLPGAAHCLRLWRPEVQQGITIAYMHGLWHPGGKGEQPEREKQAAAFIGLIRSVRRNGDAVVAGGDFNVLPDSSTFPILGIEGLRDLITRYGITGTRTSFYQKECRYADYALVSDNVRVRSFSVPASPEVSDHRPLILDID